MRSSRKEETGFADVEGDIVKRFVEKPTVKLPKKDPYQRFKVYTYQHQSVQFGISGPLASCALTKLFAARGVSISDTWDFLFFAEYCESAYTPMHSFFGNFTVFSTNLFRSLLF